MAHGFHFGGLKITSLLFADKCETMVFNRNRVECSLWVRGKLLSQVKEFKYLRLMFTNEERGARH